MATTRQRRAPAAADVIDTEGAEDGVTWTTPIGEKPAIVTHNAQNDEDIEMSIGDRIRSFVSQSGGDRVRVKVYRRDPRTGQLSYCQDYAHDVFDEDGLDLLRESWGAGEYELRVIGSTGILARPRVSIAPLLRAPTAQNPISETASVLSALLETQNRILEALSQRPDPTAGLAGTLALVSQMREAFGMNQQPVAAPAPAPAGGSLAALTEMVAAVRAMRELSKEINPESGGGDDSMVMVGQVLDIVKTSMANRPSNPAPLPVSPMIAHNPAMLANRQAFAQRQIQPQPQPKAEPVKPLQPINIPVSILDVPADNQNRNENDIPQPESEPVEYETLEGVGPPPMTPEQAAAELRGMLDYLRDMAQNNASVETGAQYVADNLPDELVDMIDNPMWFEMLRGVAPEIAPFEAWFRAVHAQAMPLLFDDALTDDDGSLPD